MRFNDVNSNDKPFGGITVLLGSDFRQTLSVVLKGRKEDVVQASINKSHIWKPCQLFVLTENMRIKDSMSFTEWVLALGDGKLPTVSLEGEDDSCWIKIPDDLLIPDSDDHVASVVLNTYLDLVNRYKDLEYLRNRGILTPTNQTVDKINSYVLNVISGDITTYLSSDSICKASGKVFDQDMMFLVEFLSSLKFLGLSNHELHLKIGIPIILLRNINPSACLCNGTRLVVTQLASLVIEGRIITGTNIGTKVFIPRIIMSSADPKWPFVLLRRQFPVCPSFSMTINKSQAYNQGDHIHATIQKFLIHKFTNLVDEGKIYSVQNFKVIDKNGNYMPVSHQYKLLLLPTTTIKELRGDYS
ncbi:hypothetical protein Dsin_015846 [Dipteronia sinensis]|uniref:ATP-dependent DNA helicase n=1 Tax=Dipteronia sinensis TaxID=43782 RepID=A0AAE0ABZ4_9ROSI|nr:hypothetical protein Dsin_015846 [Dipteronia sinensis]